MDITHGDRAAIRALAISKASGRCPFRHHSLAPRSGCAHGKRHFVALRNSPHSEVWPHFPRTLKAAHVPPPLRSLLKSMLALEPAGGLACTIGSETAGFSGHASNMRRIRFAIASTVSIRRVCILHFHSLRTHPAAAESVSNPRCWRKALPCCHRQSEP